MIAKIVNKNDINKLYADFLQKECNKKRLSCWFQHNSLFFCRGDRTRTCDILVPNQVRYQLRYAPCLKKRVQNYEKFCTRANFLAIII